MLLLQQTHTHRVLFHSLKIQIQMQTMTLNLNLELQNECFCGLISMSKIKFKRYLISTKAKVPTKYIPITRKSSCGKPQEVYCPQHSLSRHILSGGFPTLAGGTYLSQGVGGGVPTLAGGRGYLGGTYRSAPFPPGMNRETPVKTVPSPILRMQAVKIGLTYLNLSSNVPKRYQIC